MILAEFDYEAASQFPAFDGAIIFVHPTRAPLVVEPDGTIHEVVKDETQGGIFG